MTDKLKEKKADAYSERNKLVSFLSKQYPSVLAKTNIPNWLDDWHWCVFVNSPEGQMCWHIHDSELSMFDHLPRVETDPWDGHSNEEKYKRLLKLTKTIIKR